MIIYHDLLCRSSVFTVHGAFKSRPQLSDVIERGRKRGCPQVLPMDGLVQW